MHFFNNWFSRDNTNAPPLIPPAEVIDNPPTAALDARVTEVAVPHLPTTSWWDWTPTLNGRIDLSTEAEVETEKARLRELLQTNPPLAEAFLTHLGRAIASLENRLSALQYKTLEWNLLNLLHRTLEKVIEKGENPQNFASVKELSDKIAKQLASDLLPLFELFLQPPTGSGSSTVKAFIPQLLQLLFVNGKVYVPSKSKGLLLAWIDNGISRVLTNVLETFRTTQAKSQEKRENHLSLIREVGGENACHLLQALSSNFSRFLKHLSTQAEEGADEDLFKNLSSALFRQLTEQLNSELQGGLNSYSDQVLLHLFATASAHYQAEEGHSRHLLTSIIEGILQTTLKHLPTLCQSYTTYQETLDRGEQEATAKAAFFKSMTPYLDALLTPLGLTKPQLTELLPDSWQGIFGTALWWKGCQSQASPAQQLADQIKFFLKELLLDIFKEVYQPLYLHRTHAVGEQKTEHFVEEIIAWSFPLLHQMIDNPTTPLGQLIYTSLNDLLLGGLQGADAQFFQTPIQELLNSPHGSEVRRFLQPYLKKVILDLLRHAANNNPSEEPTLLSENLLARALPYLIQLARTSIQSADHGALQIWKEQQEFYLALPESNDEEKQYKEERLKELSRRRTELMDPFKAAACEWLKAGGWDDPAQIPLPSLFKAVIKNLLSDTILANLLFQIYTETKLPLLVEDTSREYALSSSLLSQSLEGMQKALANFSYLFAQLTNQTIAQSHLDNPTETFLAATFQQIYDPRNPSTQFLWDDLRRYLPALLTQGIRLLAKEATPTEGGDPLQKALFGLKKLLLSEGVALTQLPLQIAAYRKKVTPLREIDEAIASLKKEAVEKHGQDAEILTPIFFQIENLQAERRKLLIELHESIPPPGRVGNL